MTGRSRSLRGWVLALVAAFVLVGLGGCSGGSTEVLGPVLPYVHPATSEDSVAVAVDTGGPVDVMADGLTEVGFFCAQVRSSATARQIWCRATEVDLPTGEEIWVDTVDIVATPAGHVQYVRVTPPERPASFTGPRLAGGRDTDTRLKAILSASVLRLWPEDAAAVDEAIDDVRQVWSWFPTGNDPRAPQRTKMSTEHADYFVGEGTYFGEGALTSGHPKLTFVAATDQLSDAWPVSSTHALTTAVTGAPGLEAGGFDCYGPAKMPCVRVAGNQQLNYSTAPGSDTVVMADVFIGGGINEDGEFATLADRGFPQGLTFLTDAVRSAIEARLDQARHDGASFLGMIEGTVVRIDASPLPGGPDDSRAVPVTLTVGAPLVTGPFGAEAG